MGARRWAAAVAFATGASAAVPARADVADVQRRLEAIVAGRGLIGAGVAIVERSGAVWAGGFGRRAAGGAAMDADTLFRVGSVTKSFVALAIMRLVEQGRLRLEDRVRDLAPEIDVENRWEGTDPIRVAHLLEHTAGFDEMRFNEIVARDGREDRPLREVLAVNPRSRVARWRPGTRSSYSQPGYTLAAYIVEKVTGMPYEQVLEREVFAPLGIRAALRATPEARARLATGHRRGRPVGYLTLLHRPAASLMISPAGLARLMQMLLGRGAIDGQQFLAPASVARIERGATLPYGPDGVRYGLGNWGDVSLPVPLRGHGGFVPGYQTLYRYSPALGFGFAILINDSESWDTARACIGAILGHLLEAVPRLPPPAPAGDLARFAGFYRMAAPNVEFLRFHSDLYAGATVSVAGDALSVRWLGGGTSRLVPAGTDRFRLPRESGASVEFFRGERGRRAFAIHGHYFEEASAAWLAVRRWALELALLLLATTLVVPLVRALADEPLPGARVATPAACAALCLLGAGLAFAWAREHGALGTCNGATVAVWLLSWGVALGVHGAVDRAAAALTAPIGRWARAYAIATSLAAAVVGLHLAQYGLIGLRTWRW